MTERGAPIEAAYLSDGDRVLLFDDDELIAEGRVSLRPTVRVTDDEGTWFSVDRPKPGARRHLRLLRSTSPFREGTPVWLRHLDDDGASTWLEGTVKGRIDVEGTPRYSVRYHVDDGPMQLAGWSTARGVHPTDLQLREAEDDKAPSEQPAKAAVPELQLAAILAALGKADIPRPHRGKPMAAEWVGHLIKLFADQNIQLSQVREALRPIVDDGSMTVVSVTRPNRRPTTEQLHAQMRERYDIGVLTDPDAEDPAWIDDGIDPHPDWVDEVLVERALAGRYDLLDRKLSHAESLIIIGAVLDEMHAAALAWRKPDRTMTALADALGWSGHHVKVLTDEARPQHSERMKEARAQYKGWAALADGDAVYRRHRAKQGAKQKATRAAARRERRTRARAA